MNWYTIFYWLTRAESVKQFFDVASNIFTWMAIIALVVYIVLTFLWKDEAMKVNPVDYDTDKDVVAFKWLRIWFGRLMYSFLALSLITWFGYMAVPDKKDALLIVAGGATMNYLTTDSVAKQIPSEVLNYVSAELKTMAAEAKVELKSFSEKDRFLDGIKQMPTSEILHKISIDTSFARMYIQYVK